VVNVTVLDAIRNLVGRYQSFYPSIKIDHPNLITTVCPLSRASIRERCVLPINHHTIALTVTPWGYCVMVLWFYGERGLAGAHSAGLSNTITLETKALIVRIYVRPQAAASLQKSSLM
jgi:hypothetical protein